MALRGAAGMEWPEGLRVGAIARFVAGNDAALVDERIEERFAVSVLAGGELAGRFQVPHHALLVGASLAMGAAQRGSAMQDGWRFLAVIGVAAGFVFPVGRLGAEMGVAASVPASGARVELGSEAAATACRTSASC